MFPGKLWEWWRRRRPWRRYLSDSWIKYLLDIYKNICSMAGENICTIDFFCSFYLALSGAHVMMYYYISISLQPALATLYLPLLKIIIQLGVSRPQDILVIFHLCWISTVCIIAIPHLWYVMNICTKINLYFHFVLIKILKKVR